MPNDIFMKKKKTDKKQYKQDCCDRREQHQKCGHVQRNKVFNRKCDT